MLELIQVSKRFGATTALEPTSLTFERDATTVLIGPSGCGKSTLLRIAIGLVEPDAGAVRLDGTRLEPSTARALRRRMGYVIQEGGLFPHLTARDNVTLMARHIGRSARDVGTRLEELCALTRFPADGLERFPAELSGGQRQRVGLMRALMLDPDVLLLDEPLGALDPMIRAELQDDLRDVFRERGKTVVLVTHDMGEAAFLGDRVVLFRAGRIVQSGTARELLHSPAEPFVAEFVRAQRSILEDYR
ncbi:MAG: ATP-binding cassette domain-containing protein [Planctomycetota bacterium]|nr:MAG: ATP-binding cassette domain-containing protein [Planctomycetota bacterium]